MPSRTSLGKDSPNKPAVLAAGTRSAVFFTDSIFYRGNCEYCPLLQSTFYLLLIVAGQRGRQFRLHSCLSVWHLIMHVFSMHSSGCHPGEVVGYDRSSVRYRRSFPDVKARSAHNGRGGESKHVFLAPHSIGSAMDFFNDK